MNGPKAVGKALETFAWLEKEIAAAQKGPIDPKMRVELARVASATKKSLAGLAASHQSAQAMLAAKRERAAKLAAANEAAIAKNQAKILAKQQPVPPPAPKAPVIDPTLGVRLAEELVARQSLPETVNAGVRTPLGVLDDWDWRAARASSASSGPSVPCG